MAKESDAKRLRDYADLIFSDAQSMYKMAHRETGGDFDQIVSILNDTMIECYEEMGRIANELAQADDLTAEQDLAAAKSMHGLIRTIAAAAMALTPIAETVELVARQRPMIHVAH